MKNRRALSSVVGAVFAIIALTSTVVYITYSMNTVNQYNQSVISRTQQTQNTLKESFLVSGVNIIGGKFNITIANTGTIPINITKVWVQNTTGTNQYGNYWAYNWVPVNKIAGPGQTITNIGQSTPLYVRTTYSYHVKLVTSRGNIQEFNVATMGSAPLMVHFNAIPDVIPPSFTTTLEMDVTNNMTGNTYLTNVQGQIIGNPRYTGSGTTVAASVSQQAASYSVLGPGNTAVFKWVYSIDGKSLDTAEFTGGIVGSPYTYLDTVTLQDPLNAAFSANSLTSEGITCCRTNDELIVLHEETSNTVTIGNPPNQVTANQMYEGSVDNSGLAIKFKNENTNPQNRAYFITENDSVNQVDMNSGIFSLVMKYQSASVPNSITNLPDMVFYFNALLNGVPYDSAGASCTKSTAVLGGTGGTTPTFDSTPGDERDGSPLFTFDGSHSQYIDIAKNNGGGGGCNSKGNDLNTQLSTTTGWFKVTSSQKPPSGQKATILRMEGNNQWYEISMDSSGHVSFNYQLTQGTVSCTTTGNYADGNWHFFAAIRNQAESCVLDMDGGVLVAGIPTYSTALGNQFSSQTGSHAGDRFTMNTDMFIGTSPEKTSPFTGSIDNIMHWNNNDYLTDGSVLLGGTNQVSDLYNKNYGSAAHTIIVSILQTDKFGNAVNTPNDNILNPTTLSLPFYDSKQGTLSTYDNYTYTTPNLSNSTDSFGQWHFVPNTRLFLNVTWAGTSTLHPEALPMSWMIDNPNTGDPYDSWLNVPIVNTPFPSYVSFAHNTDITFSVTNSGTNGIWISLTGTELSCQTMTGGTSYSSLLKQVNSTNIDQTHVTSIFIPPNKKASLTFYQAGSQPQINEPGPGTQIVAGHYRMFIAVGGYDDTAAAINKNFYIGVVNVT